MCVQLVKLSINLLFKHLLFDVTALINELLLTLYLRSKNIELGVLLSQSIVLHFELLVKTALHFCLAFSFTLSFKSLKSFKHVLAHLFGSFLHVVKFLFILTFFSGEQTGKLCFALFQISNITASNFINTIVYDAFMDHIISLVFPLGS